MALRYATLEEIQRYAQVEAADLNMSSGDFDTLCTELGERMEARVDRFCGRSFDRTDATGEDALVVSVGRHPVKSLQIPGPIITINHVYTRDGPGDDWSELDSDYYTAVNPGIHSDVGILQKVATEDLRYAAMEYHSQLDAVRRTTYDAYWMPGFENVKVDYSYGYASVPDDIVDVVCRLVHRTLLALARDRSSRVGTISEPGLDVAARQVWGPDIEAQLRAFTATKRGIGVV